METLTHEQERLAAIVTALSWLNGDVRKLPEADRDFYFKQVLLQWETAKQELEAAKAREMDLRKQCVAIGFDPDKKSGTERVELGGGYEAKAVKKINYGFVKNPEGKTDKRAIDAALSKIEADGEVGMMIAERLIKWTPDLSLTEYKQLPAKYKPIIDAVIVTSDGAPTLEIIPPKGK